MSTQTQQAALEVVSVQEEESYLTPEELEQCRKIASRLVLKEVEDDILARVTWGFPKHVDYNEFSVAVFIYRTNGVGIKEEQEGS